MNKAEALEYTKDVVDAMVADYARFTEGWEYSREIVFDILPGSTYAKIVEVKEDGRPRRVAGFVVLKEKKFPVGTMLKAANFAAPATNFGRGMVDDPESWNHVAWTGIG